MTGSEPATPYRPGAASRTPAEYVTRSLAPAIGLTVPALVRHPVWRMCPEGRGTGVVVVPGFAGHDTSVGLLRRWLRRRGYLPSGAGLGINIGCTSELAARLEQRVMAHAVVTGGPVLLVGHSRGGLLARMVAAARPDLVAGLAMIGSPVLNPLDAAGLVSVVLPRLVRLSELGVRGLLDADCLTGPCGDTTIRGLTAPLRSPSLAVYSRSDGVVGWRSCQEPAAEWVEVTSSHTGMVSDPAVFVALAPRLAAWVPGSSGAVAEAS